LTEHKRCNFGVELEGRQRLNFLVGGIAEINPRHPKDWDDSLLVSFAPMAVLSESSLKFDFLAERPLGEVRKGFTHFAEGDVLFAKITPCMENGKGAVATGLRNGAGCGTTELQLIRPLGGIDPHYFYHFLHQQSFRREAKANFTGTAGQARVPTAFMEQARFPLPPRNEQRRIVAKLEKLLNKVDSCQKRLSKIPLLLGRFRQAVLAGACSGELTAEWRDRNDAKIQAAGPHGLVSIVGDQPPSADIPETWTWVRFGCAIRELRNGISPRPRIDPPGTPILRISAVRPGRVDLTDIRYLEDSCEFLSKFSLANDDLLFTRYNGSIELLGVCGMVLGLRNRTVLYPDKLIRWTGTTHAADSDHGGDGFGGDVLRGKRNFSRENFGFQDRSNKPLFHPLRYCRKDC
jgi:type I restriction enzyme S subunit